MYKKKTFDDSKLFRLYTADNIITMLNSLKKEKIVSFNFYCYSDSYS